MSDLTAEPAGKSEHYVDTGSDETEALVSNTGVKLTPNEHSGFYGDVRGESQARGGSEPTGEPRRLVRSVRKCVAHPGDSNYDGIIEIE